jgi:uncharacterized protein (DUF488 family)
VPNPNLYTIGHSNHSIERFIELLTLHGVQAVADVRSQPYSRFCPQFNERRLRASLEASEIAYLFMGRELGARATDDAVYVGGRVDYDLLARTQAFQAGLARIEREAGNRKIALLCAERDPLTCHREILVGRALALRGFCSRHIREDGRLESHDNAVTRLLDELRMNDNELFRGRAERIAAAYRRRGEDIAFTKER